MGYLLADEGRADSRFQAKAIKTIKTELAGRWLQAQGFSARQLCALLEFHGFALYGPNNLTLTLDGCSAADVMGGAYIDVWARLRSALPTPTTR